MVVFDVGALTCTPRSVLTSDADGQVRERGELAAAVALRPAPAATSATIPAAPIRPANPRPLIVNLLSVALTRGIPGL